LKCSKSHICEVTGCLANERVARRRDETGSVLDMERKEYKTDINDVNGVRTAQIFIICLWIFVFGPKRVQVTGGSRKIHNKEFHKLCSSPSINK
jgi:hypothetical protein